MLSKLAEPIEARRRELGLSYRALAEKAAVPLSTVYRICKTGNSKLYAFMGVLHALELKLVFSKEDHEDIDICP